MGRRFGWLPGASQESLQRMLGVLRVESDCGCAPRQEERKRPNLGTRVGIFEIAADLTASSAREEG